MRHTSLTRRVALTTALGTLILWCIATLLMAWVLRGEQEELFDQQLQIAAQILLPLLEESDSVPDISAPSPDEALIFQLYDATGQMIYSSPLFSGAIVLDGLEPGHLSANAEYRIFTTEASPRGNTLVLAAPLAERREAFRESMTAFLLPMLLLLPLMWTFTASITRRSLRPLDELSTEITKRGGSDLDQIPVQNWPRDIALIAHSFNAFLKRLSHSIEAERNFATNTAHELRTPVAIALAQAQALRMNVRPEDREALDRLERGLQRMRRLVARLLQLARAEAGIGPTAEAQNIATLTHLVLQDVVSAREADRIMLIDNGQGVVAQIDPDAYAILLSNLVENALQHSPADTPIKVLVNAGNPILSVRNQGPKVSELDHLAQRYARKGSDGFGLGLHICRQISSQAGGALILESPITGQHDGFAANVSLPLAGQAT